MVCARMQALGFPSFAARSHHLKKLPSGVFTPLVECGFACIQDRRVKSSSSTINSLTVQNQLIQDCQVKSSSVDLYKDPTKKFFWHNQSKNKRQNCNSASAGGCSRPQAISDIWK